MLTTFFSEPTTQSKTALSFGTRLMVFSGLNTRSTRNDFMVARFWPKAPPPSPLFFSSPPSRREGFLNLRGGKEFRLNFDQCEKNEWKQNQNVKHKSINCLFVSGV